MEYFEGGKDEHYKQDLSYNLVKVRPFGMQMQLTSLAEVVTFQQGNCYISRTLLSAVNATEKGIVNWAKWLKVQLHKEMIAIQKKARKVGNNLIGLARTLVAKHYTTHRVHRRR